MLCIDAYIVLHLCDIREDRGQYQAKAQLHEHDTVDQGKAEGLQFPENNDTTEAVGGEEGLWY